MIPKVGRIIVLSFIFGMISTLPIQSQQPSFTGWETDLSQKSIDLTELRAGGPGKGGIPAINDPSFIKPNAATWLGNKEPVIALEINGKARAYPLQILIWHEIVNDKIDGKAVLVTFCPLCYSAIVFSRTVNNKTLTFGVSGFLRHSDMVMYDHATESLWQQFNGNGIVGEYTNTTLKQLPSQLISFAQFKEDYPNGMILSRDTGYRRNYGQNPYQGYDDINNSPFMLNSKDRDSRMRPMQKVVGVMVGGEAKSYSYEITLKEGVINDIVNDREIVIFHSGSTTSALDASSIAQSKTAGSTGAFKRKADGKQLTFIYTDSTITDEQTGSTWSVTGKSTGGPLKGTQLNPLDESGDYFAFAWLVFYPETTIYSQE